MTTFLNTLPVNRLFGTRWITNGLINKRIPARDPIPTGFYQGQTLKSDMLAQRGRKISQAKLARPYTYDTLARLAA